MKPELNLQGEQTEEAAAHGGSGERDRTHSDRVSTSAFLRMAASSARCLAQSHAERTFHGCVNSLTLGVGRDLRHAGVLSLQPHVPGQLQPLAYSSPEQTGRVNRGIDHRSDYYSLGVVFYEWLTGRLPFVSNDALELVHGHIARQPIPPTELDPAIPQPLNDITLKLLSKNAEDRYQTMDGLLADLQRCQTQLDATGRIAPFPLGEQDRSDRLQIPQKLYGRENEVGQLLAAFDSIATGGARLLLVTGNAGIGKTTLINELQKPVVLRRGYFISGKFDQFARNIPYSAMAQAFRALIRQILTENEQQLAGWRSKFLDALGPNGQIMVDAIPELEHIIGKQAAVAQLGAIESQNRFNYVVQNFVAVLATPEHPLVIFLDDMQWADAASLKLISLFMRQLDHPALLVICAYRDNETHPGDALSLTVEEIRKQAAVEAIEVQALTQESVTDLVRDTVRADSQSAAPLAELIFRKTLGNPFFVGQFLNSLYQERMLAMSDGRWHWSIDQIRALGITDNVADLLTKQLARLPPAAQQLLTLAACIGNRFGVEALATIGERTMDEVEALLQPARHAGMIVHAGALAARSETAGSYRFAHDRVQQAAYAQVPASQRQALHLRIGRLLFNAIPEAQREERIFDIVKQFNEGSALIREPDEQEVLVRLNMTAGRRAKAAAAFDSALAFCTVAKSALPAGWERSHYTLGFECHLALAEAEYMNARFEECKQVAGALLHVAAAALDRASVHRLLLQCAFAESRLREAIASGVAALAELGVQIPVVTKTSRAQLILRMLKVKWLLRGRTPAQLEAPPAAGPVHCAAIETLCTLFQIAWNGAPELLPIAILESLYLTLRYGNTPYSNVVFAGYALILSKITGKNEESRAFAELAMRMNERCSQKFRGVVDYVLLMYIVLNDASSEDGLMLEASNRAMANGDLPMGVADRIAHAVSSFSFGESIMDTERKIIAAHRFAKKYKFGVLADLPLPYLFACLGLTGNGVPKDIMDDPADRAGFIRRLQVSSNYRALYNAYTCSAFENFLFGDVKGALAAARSAAGMHSTMKTSPAMFLRPAVCIYALALLAEMNGGSHAGMAEWRELKQVRKRLRGFIPRTQSPHLHKWNLVEAERYRVLGKPSQASKYYKLAIEEAKTHHCIGDEALSNELAAKFYLTKGEHAIARVHLEEAHARYAQWGAAAKCRQLEQTYPELLTRLRAPHPLAEVAASPTLEHQLDIATFVKASHTLAGEIQLTRLLETLMRLVLASAGAERGLLLLQKDGKLVIQALASGDRLELLQGEPVEYSHELSLGVVNYVRHTREQLVLGNAVDDARFHGDPYLQRARPKSVLCAALERQCELIGLLYLENNLATDAFTPARVELLRVLSTQMAISLVNARLYHELEHKEEELEQRLAVSERELSRIYDARAAEERERAATRERQRITRDLHDGLGMQIATTLQLASSAETPRATITEQLRQTLEQLKLTVDALEDVGNDLGAVLGNIRYRLAARIESSGVALHWQVERLPALPGLSSEAVRHIQYIMLESLSNTFHHARAKSVTLQAWHDAATDHVHIVIADDGIGFDTGSGRGGRGLANLRARAQALGAQLSLRSERGESRHGTTIELRLPVGQPEPASDSP